MADSRDILGKNRKFTGTTGIKIPSGTQAQRVNEVGQLRFNSDTGLMEYYDGTLFKSIDAPPVVSGTGVANITETQILTGSYELLISGTGFASGATVKFIGNDGTEYASPTVTFNSNTSLSAVVPNTLTDTNEPYDVRVTNISGLSNTLADAFSVNAKPVFGVASGSLGTLTYFSLSSSNLTAVTATDDESDAITFAITSGSIPSGLTFNSDGTWSGSANTVVTDTTSTFTVTATAGGQTSSRQYTITVNALQVQSFTSSGTWTVPAGVTEVIVLAVAGGGAGGSTNNGGQSNRGSGAGAGGVILITNWNVTGASSYSINIGQGGTVGTNSATNGGNTTISGGSKTLTAIGGGRGGWSDSTDNGATGGSGGSSWYPTYSANAGTQPSNTNDGVTTYNATGYGNASGSSLNSEPYGGGGGGAGSAGMNAQDARNGATSTDSQGNSLTGDAGNGIGGTGLYIGNIFGTSYGESGFVASGGTSAGFFGNATKAHLGGGGIGYNASTSTPSNAQANGQANTGGGGGSGGNGGSGLVLIGY